MSTMRTMSRASRGLLAMTLLLLVATTASAQTTLEVNNGTSQPVDVWVTVGAVTGCATLADFSFITHVASSAQGWFT